MTALGSNVIFGANDADFNIEPRISNGTAQGTTLLKDINARTDQSAANQLITLGNEVFFIANDYRKGAGVWKSDGTEANTRFVKEPAVLSPPQINFNTPSFITNINGTVYFSWTGEVQDMELWKTDGTSEGTVQIKNINPSGHSEPREFFAFNGAIYFSAATAAEGRELWKTDGTDAGTVLVKDINPGTANSTPISFTILNNQLFL